MEININRGCILDNWYLLLTIYVININNVGTYVMHDIGLGVFIIHQGLAIHFNHRK